MPTFLRDTYAAQSRPHPATPSLLSHPHHLKIITCIHHHFVAYLYSYPTNLFAVPPPCALRGLVIFNFRLAMCQLLSRSRASPLIAEFAHLVVLLCALAILVTAADAMHHMKMIPPASKVASRQSPSTVPLIVTNQCASTIYPGILTQSGTGPGTGGFQLTPGSNMSMTVSHNWQGRVWGRTNCSFTGNSGSGSCGSGDCSGGVSCTGTVSSPPDLLM